MQGLLRVLGRNQLSSTFRQCTVGKLFTHGILQHGFWDMLKHSGCQNPNNQKHEKLGLCQLDPFLPAAPLFLGQKWRSWSATHFKAGPAAAHLPTPAARNHRVLWLVPSRTTLKSQTRTDTGGPNFWGLCPLVWPQTPTWGLLAETQV